MSTPKDLFILAKYNYIIDHYVHSWRHGNIEWLEMLGCLAQELEKEIIYIVDKNDIRKLFEDNKISSAPTPIFDYSLIPDLSNVTSKIKQQELLIAAIIRICTMRKIVLDIVLNKLNTSSPHVIVVDKDVINKLNSAWNNKIDL